jgi:hypothetical protein
LPRVASEYGQICSCAILTNSSISLWSRSGAEISSLTASSKKPFSFRPIVTWAATLDSRIGALRSLATRKSALAKQAA